MLLSCARGLQSAVASQLRTATAAAAAATLVRPLSVSVREQDQVVLVKEHEHQATPLSFPGVWLRDNCQCAACFHRDSQSRKISWTNFDTSVRVQDISADAARGQVHVRWSDEHASTYDLAWLRERDFSPESRERHIRDWYRPQPQPWGREDFERILKRLEYRDVMEKDEVLLDWLETLAVHGVCMLKNAPLHEGVVKALTERIGFIRRTTYGEEFSVKSRPGAKNYSYLAEPLPLHTDLPYYEYKPSVTILHSLVQSQSTGGWNTLTDAFHVADQLRAQHPEDFRTLAETRVDWCDIGSDAGVSFHNIWRAPVINLDADGNYARINHSVPQRDTHFSVALEQVRPWYEANARFVRMAHEQATTFKTTPGDVFSFNNLRMLHGRTGYSDTEQNVRHIVGGFVDWDIVYSRMRVLKRSLASAEEQQAEEPPQELRQRQ